MRCALLALALFAPRLLPAAEGDVDGELSGTVFKIERGSGGDKVAYVRLVSGDLHARDRVRIRGDDYKVTAMIDDGTPHVQTLKLPTPVPSTLPPVVFAGMPLGGNLNVSVAFAQAATGVGANDILLGKGTTGVVANDGSAHGLTIDEIRFPIGPTTSYRHQQKTQLSDADRQDLRSILAPT